MKIPKKCYKIKWPCSYIWHIIYWICVLIRHTFCESLVKICFTKHKCHSFLWYYFQTLGQYFRPAQTKSIENQKSGHNRINWDNIPDHWRFFWLSILVVQKHCPMSEKISPKWTAFVFGNTYLHQNFSEYMSNKNAHFGLLTARCNWKLWKVLWFYWIFWVFL